MTAAAQQSDYGPISDEEWARHRREAMQSLPHGLEGQSLPDVLLPHQKDILVATSTHALVATDKSRRIGATWGVASDAVLVSGARGDQGGMDTLYIGYNLDMAREFIDTVAMWARAFMPAASEVGEFLFIDKGAGKDGADTAIQAFRIRFASGFEVIALSSRPRSLRGRQGYVILDEFAFHDDAEELLKAAMAFTIWGGKVLVISTHNGEANPFNLLINDIRAGKYGDDATVVRCTFDDAVKNGLYERVCLKRGIDWTPEGEAAWRSNIRKLYRHNAAEELDCVPSMGSGVYLSRALIEARAKGPNSVVLLHCPPGFELQPVLMRESYVQAWLDQTVKPLLDALPKGLRCAVGHDFARNGDVSAYVPMLTHKDLSREVPFAIEMRNVPYEQQRQVFFWVTKRLPRFTAAKLDGTGNGGYLGEVAVQEFGAERVESVKLSQAWYAANMPRVKAGFEDAMIQIPANDNFVSDMGQVRIVQGIAMVPAGVTIEGSDGLMRHGDFAVAVALAWAASLVDVGEYAYHAIRRDGSGGGGPRDFNRPDHRGDFPVITGRRGF